MYYTALTQDWEGVYNAAAPIPVSNSKLIREIAERLRKHIFLPNIPKFIMKLVLGEMHILLFTSQKVSSAKAESKKFAFRFKTLDNALEDLIK